jgi:hypothetical protein
MIKFHVGGHLRDWTRGRGSLLYCNDEDGEVLHKSNAKEPWLRSNTHRGAQGAEHQMAHIVGRGDVLRLMVDVRQQAEAAYVAVPQAMPIDNNAPPAKLMGTRRIVCRIPLGAAAAAHAALAQLQFSIALYLQLATNGSEDVDYPRRMPFLTSSMIEVRPGVAVVRWPQTFLSAANGGSKLHADLQPTQTRGAASLQPTGEPPVFVAVDGDDEGELWYGQLVLCFVAQYMGAQELCYIRWLDTVEMRAKLEGDRALTAFELAGPFERYRWSTQPGSRRRGHPLAGGPHYGVVSCSRVRYRAPLISSILHELDEVDPLFRLNTDMYLL